MSEHCPKSLPIDHFAVKPLIVFFCIAVMATCPAGAWVKVGLKPELCCLTNELQRFYLLQNHRKNCVEFEFFLGLLKKPKFRQEKYYFNANPPGWQLWLRSGYINRNAAFSKLTSDLDILAEIKVWCSNINKPVLAREERHKVKCAIPEGTQGRAAAIKLQLCSHALKFRALLVPLLLC